MARRETLRVLQVGVGSGWVDISTWSDDLIAWSAMWSERQMWPHLRFRVVVRRRKVREYGSWHPRVSEWVCESAP
jgi:hypothetical protein